MSASDRIPPRRTLIKTPDQAKTLKPGDHIAWKRSYIICHHAIAVDTDEENNTITVIHWNKVGKCMKIIEETMKITSGLFMSVYRVDYDDKTKKENPPNEVLERARNRLQKQDNEKYSLLKNNCETFATFCKTGIDGICNQLNWLLNEVDKSMVKISFSTFSSTLKAVLKGLATVSDDALKSAAQVIPGENLEMLLRATDGVGIVIVCLIEGGFLIYDLRKFYKERKQGNMGRDDFIQKVIERVALGVCRAVMINVGSIGGGIIGLSIGSALGPVGTIVGGVIGSIIGGTIGGVVVGVGFGTFSGQFIGKAISHLVKKNEKEVDKADLKPGDHIVQYMWCLHPRCHAIVVSHDEEGVIKVIRNSYQDGVREETLVVTGTIYKIIYNEDICKAGVVERARRQLDEKKYSLASNNCKTFARNCMTGGVRKGKND